MNTYKQVRLDTFLAGERPFVALQQEVRTLVLSKGLRVSVHGGR